MRKINKVVQDLEAKLSEEQFQGDIQNDKLWGYIQGILYAEYIINKHFKGIFPENQKFH